MSTLKAHYAASNIETRLLDALRVAGFDPDTRLSPEDLGALDQFHTGSLGATRELLEIARPQSGETVVDIGAGLAGSARIIAASYGCKVACVEMSPDYCIGARLLNRITGLEERITIHEGSALALPFADHSFDLAWMQNVGMNIEDKEGLYAEIARVLKPGGRFAFQEMAAGNSPVRYYPLPWSSTAEDNFLITRDEMLQCLGTAGFVPETFEDTSDAHLARTISNATPAKSGQLSLGTYVEKLGEKAANARRSLEEGQVRLIKAVFRLRDNT